MNLYLDNGYVDMGRIINDRHPFVFVWGGRGTGKTYGALDYCMTSGVKFVYMRRTQSQLDMINKPIFSPINPVVSAHGWSVKVVPVTTKSYGFYWADDEGNALDDGLFGFTAALSTVSNLRGFAAADIADVLIYDEFIPEQHERPINHECDALLNAYETINRNRELQGRPPLKMVCLSNSNQLTNPIFEGLNLTKAVTTMRKKKQVYHPDDQRGVALYALDNSPISLAKRDTALYKLAGSGSFTQMALGNAFNSDTGSRIDSRSLTEYKPCVAVGDWCLYSHKSRTEYYACKHISGSPVQYGESPQEIRRFTAAYSWVWSAYLRNQIVFEDASSEFKLSTFFC